FRHRAEAALRAARSKVDVPAAAAAERIGACRAPGAGLLVHPPVGAELVVLLALFGIPEDLVRLVDFLELRLRALVARVDVGMELARELAERLLDLLFSRRLGDPERRVIVLEIHGVYVSSPSRRESSSSSCAIRRRVSRAASASSRINGRSRCTFSA